MSKQIEALQLALEAFEESGILWKMDKAHKAVKEALKEPSWVGLTDEEIIIMSRYDLEYAALIGEVQRKLKEKNT